MTRRRVVRAAAVDRQRQRHELRARRPATTRGLDDAACGSRDRRNTRAPRRASPAARAVDGLAPNAIGDRARGRRRHRAADCPTRSTWAMRCTGASTQRSETAPARAADASANTRTSSKRPRPTDDRCVSRTCSMLQVLADARLDQLEHSRDRQAAGRRARRGRRRAAGRRSRAMSANGGEQRPRRQPPTNTAAQRPRPIIRSDAACALRARRCGLRSATGPMRAGRSDRIRAG